MTILQRIRSKKRNWYFDFSLTFFRKNPLNTIRRIQRGQLLFSQPCETCGGNPSPLELKVKEPDNRELILKSIYQGEFPEDRVWLDNALYYGDTLWSAVLSSIQKKKLSDEKPPSNLNEWLSRQHNNIYRFATAKSYAELLEYRDKVIDPKTGLKSSFEDFKKHCDTIRAKYKENWLKAEYNAVINGTIAGTNWLEFQDNKDLFPYLKYQIVDDNRTREAHRKLRGIIEHIDSDFWKRFYPPNGWNCRCYTSQESNYNEDAEKSKENIRIAKEIVKDKYWQKNSGTQVLFDENGTAYFEAMPGRGKKQLTAAKHYGLPKAEKILERTDLPKAIIGTKEDIDGIWNNMTTDGNKIKGTCKLGLKYEFDENFKKHIQDSKHVADLPNLTEIMKEPSEVWEGWLSGGHGTQWYRKYLKYYDNGMYAVLMDSNNKATTMYKVDKIQKVEEMRIGILNYKK